MTTQSTAGSSKRANALAERLEQGARSLESIARALTDAEWQTRIAGDGRTIGVVVHHVASMYPIEIELAQTLAAGNPIKDVTWDVVHDLNARPRLPFGDGEFDGAMCAVSVQYMRRPLEIFAEVARVLKPGAPFVVSFSKH